MCSLTNALLILASGTAGSVAFITLLSRLFSNGEEDIDIRDFPTWLALTILGVLFVWWKIGQFLCD